MHPGVPYGRPRWYSFHWQDWFRGVLPSYSRRYNLYSSFVRHQSLPTLYAHFTTDGNLFILFAPHIGISDSGALGKYSRNGQVDRDGTACGAACGALKYCEECKFDTEFAMRTGSVKTKMIKKPGEIYGDYQMEFITSQVLFSLALSLLPFCIMRLY